jgi:hypothetical protein
MPAPPNPSNPGPSIVDELAAEVPDLASSRDLVLLRALPIHSGESGFAVFLGDEDMSASEFCDIAAAVGAKLLYFATRDFNVEDDLSTGTSRRLNRQPDIEDSQLAALRQEASAYDGLAAEATLGFAANGVMHYWVTMTPWFAEYVDRLDNLQAGEELLFEPMPAAEEQAMVERLAQELVQLPEFKSAANAAQRRRVARAHPEIAALEADPRFGYHRVAFAAFRRANELISEEADIKYRELEAGLEELAAEFAATSVFRNAGSARARREHAKDFLVEKAGGYPPPARLLELFLDTAPLQRTGPSRH